MIDHEQVILLPDNFLPVVNCKDTFKYLHWNPLKISKICNFLKNKDWRQQNSTAFPDEAGLLYCTPLKNIAWICSYSTGIHIHNTLFTAKFCRKVSDLNTKLIKTQFTLQESLLRNLPHVEIHDKTFEKLMRFEQKISENNLFSDTSVYR